MLVSLNGYAWFYSPCGNFNVWYALFHKYSFCYLFSNAISSMFSIIFNGIFFRLFFFLLQSDLFVSWQLLLCIVMIYACTEMFFYIRFFLLFSRQRFEKETDKTDQSWLYLSITLTHPQQPHKLTSLWHIENLAPYFIYIYLFPWKNDLCARISLSKNILYKRYDCRPKSIKSTGDQFVLMKT